MNSKDCKEYIKELLKGREDVGETKLWVEANGQFFEVLETALNWYEKINEISDILKGVNDMSVKIGDMTEYERFRYYMERKDECERMGSIAAKNLEFSMAEFYANAAAGYEIKAKNIAINAK